MADITYKIDKGNLIITCPIEKDEIVSKSGKTLRVASTEGNQKTGLMHGGKEIIIGLNAYVKK